jgi:hypothetical protein
VETYNENKCEACSAHAGSVVEAAGVEWDGIINARLCPGHHGAFPRKSQNYNSFARRGGYNLDDAAQRQKCIVAFGMYKFSRFTTPTAFFKGMPQHKA